MEKTTAEDVGNAWNMFVATMLKFRQQNNMKKFDGSLYEICTSLGDKHGRICRYVKHSERNDPKPDHPEGMWKEMAGYINYLTIMQDVYGMDIGYGIESELSSSVGQYGGK